MRFTLFASALGLVLSAGPAPAEERVDNPEFASWSKHPKGTAVTFRVTLGPGVFTETRTLVEIGAEKLVLEIAHRVTLNGRNTELPPEKREVTKTISVPEGRTKEEAASGKPTGTTEHGPDTVTVGGVEYKAVWYRYAHESNGSKFAGKRWVSDAVPGGLLKSESTHTADKTPVRVNMVLVEIKKP
jgi:hypothetical protein